MPSTTSSLFHRAFRHAGSYFVIHNSHLCAFPVHASLIWHYHLCVQVCPCLVVQWCPLCKPSVFSYWCVLCKLLIDYCVVCQLRVCVEWTLLVCKLFVCVWCLSFQCVHISVEQVVCCRLTPLQLALYKSFVASQVSDPQQEEELKVTGSALSSITQLKKLCNRRRTVLLFMFYLCVCVPFFLSLWLPFFVLFSLSFFLSVI